MAVVGILVLVAAAADALLGLAALRRSRTGDEPSSEWHGRRGWIWLASAVLLLVVGLILLLA